MPCYTDPPTDYDGAFEGHLRIMYHQALMFIDALPAMRIDESGPIDKILCQACKFLTKEQMCKIKGRPNVIWHDLQSWYSDHLALDALHNEGEERDVAIKEAERLDWKIEIDPKGSVSICNKK